MYEPSGRSAPGRRVLDARSRRPGAGGCGRWVGGAPRQAGLQGWGPPGRTGQGLGSVVAQSVHQLGLVHRGPALHADLAGALQELVLRPVLVRGALAAPAADRLLALGRGGVRDPRGLLLALALVSELLVRLLVLDLRSGHIGQLPGTRTPHMGGDSSSPRPRYAPSRRTREQPRPCPEPCDATGGRADLTEGAGMPNLSRAPRGCGTPTGGRPRGKPLQENGSQPAARRGTLE